MNLDDIVLKQQRLRLELRAALKEYVAVIRAQISCQICGAEQGPYHPNYVIWHHPNGDGHLGRYSDLVLACATIEEIDAEIARCIPLCISCHIKVHREELEEAKTRIKKAKLRRTRAGVV